MTCTLAACIILAGATQTIGSGPARVELAQSGAALIVTYHNRIVSSRYVEPWALDLAGITVTGVISSGDNVLPDDLVVTPPVGWWCDPCRVTVEEGESGAVELWPELIG
jgi:hypothetical protein